MSQHVARVNPPFALSARALPLPGHPPGNVVAPETGYGAYPRGGYMSARARKWSPANPHIPSIFFNISRGAPIAMGVKPYGSPVNCGDIAASIGRFGWLNGMYLSSQWSLKFSAAG
jgi:hypothetical protein